MRPQTKSRALWAMVGVGGDVTAAYGLDLARKNVAVIAGPPQSGRSTVLACAIESLMRGRAEVVIAAPRPSPLRAFVDRKGVRAVLSGVDLSEDVLVPLMEAGDLPVVLVIDDGELLRNSQADDYLVSLPRTGRDGGARSFSVAALAQSELVSEAGSDICEATKENC